MRTKRELKSTIEYATRAFSYCLLRESIYSTQRFILQPSGRVYLHFRKLRNFMFCIWLAGGGAAPVNESTRITSLEWAPLFTHLQIYTSKEY